MATEVSELHKSKRQLIELVERKDSEINEKNVTIKSYLNKIVWHFVALCCFPSCCSGFCLNCVCFSWFADGEGQLDR